MTAGPAFSNTLKVAPSKASAPAWSSSRIDSTAVERLIGAVTRVAPTGLLRLRLTVLVPSATVFCSTGTVKTCVRTLVAVPPIGNASVPLVAR